MNLYILQIDLKILTDAINVLVMGPKLNLAGRAILAAGRCLLHAIGNLLTFHIPCAVLGGLVKQGLVLGHVITPVSGQLVQLSEKIRHRSGMLLQGLHKLARALQCLNRNT